MREDNAFCILPKELFSQKFEDLSLSAMVLYCVLLDRQNMSENNGWKDKDGEVYLYYSTNNLSEFLRISATTVVKLMRQLEEVGLITREKQGMCKPDKIRVVKLIETNKTGDGISTYDINELEKLINR